MAPEAWRSSQNNVLESLQLADLVRQTLYPFTTESVHDSAEESELLGDGGERDAAGEVVRLRDLQ